MWAIQYRDHRGGFIIWRGWDALGRNTLCAFADGPMLFNSRKDARSWLAGGGMAQRDFGKRMRVVRVRERIEVVK